MSYESSWPWVRDRSAERAIALSHDEIHEPAQRLIANVEARTLGDLTRLTERALFEAARHVGCTDAEAASAISILAGVLAREGLRFRREHPIPILSRPTRPTPSSIGVGLVEHVASHDAYRCLLLDAPARPRHVSDPDEWSWERSGHLLTLSVRPLQRVDLETLVTGEMIGTMEAGPWGAMFQGDRAPEHARYAGRGREVVFFDAALSLRSVASIQPWSADARSAIAPTELTTLVSTLALSLAPARTVEQTSFAHFKAAR